MCKMTLNDGTVMNVSWYGNGGTRLMVTLPNTDVATIVGKICLPGNMTNITFKWETGQMEPETFNAKGIDSIVTNSDGSVNLCLVLS